MTPDEELHTVTPPAFDVFLSFTRASPGAEREAARMQQALEQRGLEVFRDVRIDEFAGITEELVEALAASKVLLAYYTREYPTRYACQWELTAAFVAAQRHGDPRARVLVLNPEPGEPDHIRPVELADAKYATTPRDDVELERLAGLIAKQVAEVHGPLGAPIQPRDRGSLPEDVLTQRQFVGRHPQMWDIHTMLHGMDLPGVHEPGPEHVLMLTCLPGGGKTSLAARYAYLYRDAYPGGVFWIRLDAGEAPTALGRFTDQLRVIARERLGLPVSGVEPARLRHMVANKLSDTTRPVLWIVDEIPVDVPDDVVASFIVPAPNVRTILTSRPRAPRGDIRELAVPGLSPGEAFAVFGVSSQDERRAVTHFVERCGGHPIVVRAAANALRFRTGPVTAAAFEPHVAAAKKSVAAVVKLDVETLDPPACQVLRVAAVLSAAPFPPVLAGSGAKLSDEGLAAAAEQLLDRGLLLVIGSAWSVHPLVSAAAGIDESVAHRVASALLPLMSSDDPNLSAHALHLGKHVGVPDVVRRELLRRVVTRHEAKGDPTAALEVLPVLLSVPPSPHGTDLLLAAAIHLACGHPVEAEQFARRALEQAETTDDYRAVHRSRLLLAQSLDQGGDQTAADAEYWHELSNHLPSWLRTPDAQVERVTAELGLVSAMRLRGEFHAALDIVGPLVTELRAAPSGPLRDELAPSATLELARLRQVTGEARVARELADEVTRHYRDLGMGAHARVLEAESVWADAYLTLDLFELRAKPENWQRSEELLRSLAKRYVEQWGPNSAVAIAAHARAAVALIALGKPRAALRALGEVEREIAEHLGDHPLLFRVRYAQSQGHGQLTEYARQRDVLLKLLPAQDAQLGPRHPETLATKLDLGISYAMTGDRDRAIELVDDAAQQLRAVLGIKNDLSGRATTAQPIVRLPYLFLKTFLMFDGLFGAKKKTE